MKKNRLNFLIAIALIAVACFFLFRNNFSTVREENRNFTIDDTAAVTKIFIADRNNNSVTLERKGPGEWLLNGSHKTRQQGISLILDCLKKIRVQSRVPKNTFNTVVKELASTGIKLEVYLRGEAEPFKVYFIGGSTQDVLGTYMMLSNSTVPFVTEVPGFNGYLTPRFSPVERDWMITEMFHLRPEEIKSVTLEYTNQPQKSFTIERNGNAYHVYSPSLKLDIKDPDTIRISNYLDGFRELNFETWDRFMDDRQRDSIRNTTPVSTLTVVDSKGMKTAVPMYLKPVTMSSLAQVDSTGKDLKFDIDRMYAFIKDGKELVTIQYFVFSKIFAGISDFDRNTPRSKLQL
ncbi:hypothetical protein BH11BAC1_BH11BAC1_21660 [soil metagenome]